MHVSSHSCTAASKGTLDARALFPACECVALGQPSPFLIPLSLGNCVGRLGLAGLSVQPARVSFL